MLIKYQDFNMRQSTLDIIDQANEIFEHEDYAGTALTLRQLYYAFVSRDIIPNTKQSYDRFGTTITKGRLAGLISWYSIEDRTREARLASRTYTDTDEIMGDLDWRIHVNPWDEQDYYVEVWIEKDALVNVAQDACLGLNVGYMACKGYLSASMAWEAGNRFRKQHSAGKKCVLIHLGDHDPSGLDMTRDNKERMDLFTRGGYVDVRRIALTMDQVREFNPPPNPAKMSDGRAKPYIAEFGKSSWELDAIRPPILVRMIEDEINPMIDWANWNSSKQRQADLRNELIEVGNRWPEIQEFLRGN